MFACGWAATGALRAAREHAPFVGVWLPGVVALVAYAVSGCPVIVPVGCGCGVSLFVRVVVGVGAHLCLLLVVSRLSLPLAVR